MKPELGQRVATRESTGFIAKIDGDSIWVAGEHFEFNNTTGMVILVYWTKRYDRFTDALKWDCGCEEWVNSG